MINNNEMLLLKLGEVVLKGLNRRSFEDKLVSNVRRRLKSCGSFQVYVRQSTIYVEPQKEDCDMEAALSAAEAVGYPVLLKASAGGGGRGIRRCDRPEDLPSAYAEAKAEAQACFGNDEMYLEKLVLRPRHIEFQVLSDRFGHVIHLGARELWSSCWTRTEIIFTSWK